MNNQNNKEEPKKKSALTGFILLALIIGLFVWLYRKPENRRLFNFIFLMLFIAFLIILLQYFFKPYEP